MTLPLYIVFCLGLAKAEINYYIGKRFSYLVLYIELCASRTNVSPSPLTSASSEYVFVLLQKNDLMGHVAHQTIVMQFILELARSLKVDPRGCVKGFFSR